MDIKLDTSIYDETSEFRNGSTIFLGLVLKRDSFVVEFLALEPSSSHLFHCEEFKHSKFWIDIRYSFINDLKISFDNSCIDLTKFNYTKPDNRAKGIWTFHGGHVFNGLWVPLNGESFQKKIYNNKWVCSKSYQLVIDSLKTNYEINGHDFIIKEKNDTFKIIAFSRKKLVLLDNNDSIIYFKKQ